GPAQGRPGPGADAVTAVPHPQAPAPAGPPAPPRPGAAARLWRARWSPFRPGGAPPVAGTERQERPRAQHAPCLPDTRSWQQLTRTHKHRPGILAGAPRAVRNLPAALRAG